MRKLNQLHRKSYQKDLVFAVLVTLLPFLFFMYNLAPENEQIWETQYFVIDSAEFGDVEYYLWYYSSKILTLSFLILWFVTCKHWWRYVILIPTIIELYKFIGLIIDDDNSLIRGEFKIEFIIIIPIVLLIVLISVKTNYYVKSKDFNVLLDSEINILMRELSYLEKTNYSELKLKLIKLRKRKSIMTQKEYLVQLIFLRDSCAI